MHSSCKVYHALCSCREGYVGETKKNRFCTLWWTNKPSNKLKPAACHEQNIDHYFTWKIICNAPSNTRTGKNIEAFFTAIMRPSLNEQIDSDALILPRNGVTWFMRQLPLIISF